MSEFKVGDRVKATLGENVIVGEVASRPVASELELEIGGKWPRLIDTEEGWRIEKVSPPLPTKVGAIVRANEGEIYARMNGELSPWVNLRHGTTHIDQVVSYDGFEVIFEGVGDD